jgi:hypothetical protein
VASYHVPVQIISRSHGQSTVAAAGYRAGEHIRDENTGLPKPITRPKNISGGVRLNPKLRMVAAPRALRFGRFVRWLASMAVQKSSAPSGETTRGVLRGRGLRFTGFQSFNLAGPINPIDAPSEPINEVNEFAARLRLPQRNGVSRTTARDVLPMRRRAACWSRK